MTMMLGVSGRKQSGKNTLSNALFASGAVAAGAISYYSINSKGELVVPALAPDHSIVDMIFDPLTHDKKAQQWLSQMVWPVVKIYSFANPLKEFCMKVFGLTREQCYGTDADKNSPTSLRWEDAPMVLTKDFEDKWGNSACEYNMIVHDAGFMSAREVLQYFGTDVCRKMCNPCWVNATINEIKEDAPDLAIISDVRFPNEAEGIKKAGGKVMRLLRNPCGTDAHASELALDNYNDFDIVLDNSSMDIKTQNEQAMQLLRSKGVIPWK